MKLIGVRRALILAILFAVNLAIAAAFFLQLSPMRDDAQRKLDGVNTQIGDTSQKIASIKSDLETFNKTLPQYQALQAKGFTLNQDRFRMSRDLDDVRKKAQLAGFSFSIADIKKIESADAKGANLQLIDSRIKIDNVVSLLDLNFYDFVDLMGSDFPLHVRLQSFDLLRKDPLNAAALAHIARKDPVNLISATAEFDWLTVVPQQEQAGAAPTGGL